MTKRFCLSIFLLVSALATFAVPAIPTPVEITLADGTTTQVYLRGDEFASYYTTLDGVPMRLENGVLIEDASLPMRATEKRRMARAHQAATLASTFPTTGSPHCLVLLVNFTDQQFVRTKEEFESLVNESGYTNEHGAAGSLRDYFIASSDSVFQPIFDVYGPYNLPHDMKYYGEPDGNDIKNDIRAAEMIEDACAQADNDVDFSQYDTNNDGVIDNVFIYYAGYAQAEGAHPNTIWPHRSVVPNGKAYDGKILKDYACTAELRGTSGSNICGIGTFCHEFSHVLGLADLYDIDGTKNTIGNWDLMASGNYNADSNAPPTYSAFERFSVGWLTPEVLTEPSRYILEPLTATNKAYLVAADGVSIRPNLKGEYFLLENRQRVGWEATAGAIPGEGMLIWHIDYKAWAWAENRPNSGDNFCCFIETAVGSNYTTGRESDPYPGTRNVTQFVPKLVDGTDLQKPILDIQEAGDLISFVYIKDGNSALSFSSTETVYLESNFTILPNGADSLTMPAQRLELIGVSLDPSIPVNVSTNNRRFQISVDSLDWKNSLSLTPTIDSMLTTPIYVRFRPLRQECDYLSTMLVAQQVAALQNVPLEGRATRAVLITEPIGQPTTNITPYSAELNWNAVYDATHYYLTLYSLKEGETRYEQSFETFDSPSAVTLAGWQSNFNTLSSLLQATGSYSMWFKQTGDQVVSEKYLQPITSLSFWYSVPTTEVDTVGELIIQGSDGRTWETIDSLTIKKRDRKRTFEADLTDKGYLQIRITFVGNEGANGVCVDDYVATCGTYVDYLYQGDEWVIEATDDKPIVHCYVDGLEPNANYFYKVRVSDKGRGGCEEHIKEMQEPQSFTTLIGRNEERDLTYGIDSIHYSQAEHVIYVPEAEGDRTLYFYDVMGRLIGQVAVAKQENRVAFPEGNFISGNIYIVKYAVTDKLKRKDRRIKIVY